MTTEFHQQVRDNAPFVLVPQYFGSTVFDRSTSRYLPFDAETTALLRQLQVEPFAQVLGGLDTGERREQAIRFFEHFYQLGFFSLDGRFVGATLDVVPPADHLVGPLAVHLEVIASCNLTCTHCFAGTLPRNEQPLTLAELDQLFAVLASMGAFRLGLTGGEPLLRRDFFEILDLATSHGLHPCLTTNGLLITDRIAREFARRELVWLNISVDGATADTNDRIRGQGTFERVMARLSVLGRHARFTLAFTITRENVKEMERCVDLAQRVGAHTAVFRPLYPVGIARQHLDLMPTFAQYSEALNTLAGMEARNDFNVRALDSFSPQARAESQAVTSKNWGCGAGNHVCSISVGGDVNPCSFLGPNHVAANLRDRSLADIWHHSQGFQDMRAASQPGVPEEETFSGGCRARALVFNGSADAPDPWVTEGTSSERLHRHPLAILRVVR